MKVKASDGSGFDLIEKFYLSEAANEALFFNVFRLVVPVHDNKKLIIYHQKSQIKSTDLKGGVTIYVKTMARHSINNLFYQ